MSARTSHVPIDRLTALAFVVRAPEGDQDEQALRHVAECERCAAELARLTVDADEWRDAAIAEADAVFDDARLETQRVRILDRLEAVGFDVFTSRPTLSWSDAVTIGARMISWRRTQ